MGNCDPYSDSPSLRSSINHSLLGSKGPAWLCNHVRFDRWTCNEDGPPSSSSPQHKPAAPDYAPICWAKSTTLTDTTSKSPGLALSGMPTGPPPYSFGR
jgi:hypothetical protein